jgi:hypothetical protein
MRRWIAHAGDCNPNSESAFPKAFQFAGAYRAKECDVREIKEGSLGLEVVEGASLIDNIVQYDGGSASSLQPASGRLVRGTSESSRTAADDADGRVGKRRSGGLRISLAL